MFDFEVLSWRENPDVWLELMPQILESIESIPDSSNWTRERLLACCDQGPQTCRAALDEEWRLAGFVVAYQIPYLNAFLYPEPCLVFRRIYVVERHRRKGLGSYLFRNTLEDSDGLPIAWQTSTENDEARPFFGSLGAKPSGLATRDGRADHVYWIEPDDG